MRRAAGLLLALLFAFQPISAAAATADSEGNQTFPEIRTGMRFSDVAQGSRYEAYSNLCYRIGLLNGKPSGLFAPMDIVGLAEAATTAARFHELLHGGDGILPAAPEQLGSIDFLDEAGLSVISFDQVADWTAGAGVLYLRFTVEGLAALRGRENPVNQLTMALENSGLSVGRQHVTGEYQVITGGTTLEPDPWVGYVFDIPESSDPSLSQQLTAYHLLKATYGQLKDRWYRDTQWYLCLNYSVFQNADTVFIRDRSATRGEFFSLLAAAVPKSMLTRLNSITALPDTQDSDLLDFYNAGVLTGTDEYGTFAAERNLTRAEMAAMLARIVRPELRLSFVPARAAAVYTLTPLADGVDQSAVESVARVSRGSALLAVRHKNGLLALWDWTGHQLTQPVYQEIAEFAADGAAAVCRNGLWGYLDLSGKEIVPCEYEHVTQYHDGVFLTGNGQGSWLVFNRSGTLTGKLPANVNFNSTQGGYIQYRDSKTAKYGYLNADGTIAIPAAYTSVYPYSEGYFPVGDGQYKGFIDRKGNISVPLTYAYIQSGFSEGKAIVGTAGSTPNPLHYDGKYGAVDMGGNVVIPFIYDYLRPFSDGLAPFIREDADGSLIAGYVSADGKERVTNTSAASFSGIPADYSSGYACTLDQTSGKYGFANTKGMLAVPAIFNTIYGAGLSDGSAVVKIADQMLLLTVKEK